MTTFKVTITRQVTRCAGKFEGKVDVIATPEIVLDDDQRYVLKSHGWWATSDISSELSPDGISTALNAASEDQTARVMANLVGTFANIAVKSAAGAAGEKAGTGTAANYCSSAIAAHVVRLYPDPAGAAKPLKTKMQEQTVILTRATAALALAVQEAKYDRKLRPAVLRALREQKKQRERLAKLEADFEKAVAATTDSETVRWPRNSRAVHTDEPFKPSTALYGKWITGLDRNDFEAQMSVHLALSSAAEGTTWERPSLAAQVDVADGVPVRMAKTGQLLACVAAACDGASGSPAQIAESRARIAQLQGTGAAAETIEQEKLTLAALEKPTTPIVKGHAANILQLGQFYIVPVAGGTFRSQHAQVKMDDNGLPKMIQVAEKGAAAAALTGASLDTSKQLAALPAQVRSAALDRTNTQIAQSKADAALATIGTVNETATIQVQTALANAGNEFAASLARARTRAETSDALSHAQLFNARADLALAELRNGDAITTAEAQARVNMLTTQDALQVATAKRGVVDQTSVLDAQTALINAQAAQVRAGIAHRAALDEAALP